jgi:hypothetical protein
VPLIGWGLAAMKMISIDRSRRQGCARPGRHPGPRTAQARLLRHHLPGRHPRRAGPEEALQAGRRLPGDPRRLQGGAGRPRCRRTLAAPGLSEEAGTVTVSIGPAFDATGMTEAEVNQKAEAWIEGEMHRISPHRYPDASPTYLKPPQHRHRRPGGCLSAAAQPAAHHRPGHRPSRPARRRAEPGPPRRHRKALIREHGQWVLDKLANWRERAAPQQARDHRRHGHFCLGEPVTVTIHARPGPLAVRPECALSTRRAPPSAAQQPLLEAALRDKARGIFAERLALHAPASASRRRRCACPRPAPAGAVAATTAAFR